MIHWRQTSCGCCNGLTWQYGDECPICWGKGFLWVSENDRLAVYPGGPLRGYEPGRFQKEMAR